MGVSNLFKAMAITAIIATTAAAQAITSMTLRQGEPSTIAASETGNAAIQSPIFNGGTMNFSQAGDDLRVFVRFGTSDPWVVLNHSAESGWHWERDWGYWWNDNGGIWFNSIERTTYVRLQSNANQNVRLDYTITFSGPTRNGFALTVFDGTTTLTANNDCNIGFVFPRIGGTVSRATDWPMFVYEIEINGQWVPMSDPRSTWMWQGGGYNNMSPDNQFSQWWDAGFSGLWFQPVTQNYRFRIGYPANGQVGGAIGSNWLIYNFVGSNRPGCRPDPSQFPNIPLGGTTPGNLPGWTLYWNDEFSGTEIDRTKWRVDVGYHLGNPNQDGSDLNVNCGTWGWGNEEIQHYRDHENNVFVRDGFLHLVARANDPRDFTRCGQRPTYSSGKVLSDRRFNNNAARFNFKYGRIDFRISLPGGVAGTWPAAWMMPEHDVYGGWASSGEIDVMEAMGRLPHQSVGAIHFGGAWPANTHLAGYNRERDGAPFDTREFNVYSVVWQQDSIKWYVNGRMFYAVSHTQWHSVPSSGVPTNPYAPFDQEFHIIMNLAVGGWFDPEGSAAINPAQFPATMRVDYVRVFKPDGSVGIGGGGGTLPERRTQNAVGFAGIRSGQIALRMPDGAHTVEIYNVKGRLVRSVNVEAANGINLTGLRMDSLGKGVHILNVKRNGVSVFQQRLTPIR
jgi:beta-glucanase (GH16 family)